MKNKKILFGIMLICIFALSVGLSYAWYSAYVHGNDSAQNATATVSKLGEVVFADGNVINGNEIFPSWSTQKTFTISNSKNATENSSYAIILNITSNTLTDACIKVKEDPVEFTTYNSNAWNNAWADDHSSDDIIWNCTY